MVGSGVLAKLYVSSIPSCGELKTTQVGGYSLNGGAFQIVCKLKPNLLVSSETTQVEG